MAAIAILDLLRKNPNFGTQAFNSRGLFSTNLVGAPAIAASFAITTPFAFGALFGNGASRVSYCDAGTTALDGDYVSSIRTASAKIFQNEALIYNYNTKQYDIQLKPLFSAFYWKTFALTSLRSFLLFYLPLLEPRSVEDDNDDFLEENLGENHVNLVVPFKKSIKQIVRETSVVTTRRVLERLSVHYVSQRMTWKLLKDVPKSATRKAGRRMPTFTYIFSVSRTTFRGHFLGVLASWVVQVGIDVYRFITSICNKARNDNETVDTTEQLVVLGKKVHGTTVRCCASLFFASIGAGIGATLVRPSVGQWIGCTIGDLTGPIVIAFCFEKLHLTLG